MTNPFLGWYVNHWHPLVSWQKWRHPYSPKVWVKANSKSLLAHSPLSKQTGSSESKTNYSSIFLIRWISIVWGIFWIFRNLLFFYWGSEHSWWDWQGLQSKRSRLEIVEMILTFHTSLPLRCCCFYPEADHTVTSLNPNAQLNLSCRCHRACLCCSLKKATASALPTQTQMWSILHSQL